MSKEAIQTEPVLTDYKGRPLKFWGGKAEQPAQQEPVAWLTEERYAEMHTSKWTPKIQQVFSKDGILESQTIQYAPQSKPVPYPPAQQEPKIDIYRSFEQWKSGNVLEHGVPRTEFYTKADLDLVEMGWRYGYDAGRAVEQALDKKAENARELGLDYESAQQEPVAKHYANGGHLVYPAAQRPWVGLTDEEIQECWYKTQGDAELFARAIDAALRSKNEPR